MKGEKIALEKEIANLKITLETYEDFVEEVKLAGMKVVSYEYDGAIVGLQRYNEGETLNVIDSPADTENVKFVGWTLDGSTLIDLSNFTVNDNVTFVAKLSRSYNVNFMVDDEIFSTQKVAENGSCTVPTEIPDKFGYTFAGWSLDGVNVLSSIEQEVVLGDVNYIAVFDLFEVKVNVWLEFSGMTPCYYAKVSSTDIPWSVSLVDGFMPLYYETTYVYEPGDNPDYPGGATVHCSEVFYVATGNINYSLPFVSSVIKDSYSLFRSKAGHLLEGPITEEPKEVILYLVPPVETSVELYKF